YPAGTPPEVGLLYFPLPLGAGAALAALGVPEFDFVLPEVPEEVSVLCFADCSSFLRSAFSFAACSSNAFFSSSANCFASFTASFCASTFSCSSSYLILWFSIFLCFFLFFIFLFFSLYFLLFFFQFFFVCSQLIHN